MFQNLLMEIQGKLPGGDDMAESWDMSRSEQEDKRRKDVAWRRPANVTIRAGPKDSNYGSKGEDW